MAYDVEGYAILPLLSGPALQGMRDAIQDRISRAAEDLRLPDEARFPHEAVGKRLESIARHGKAHADAILLALYSDAQEDERISFLAGFPPLRKAAEKLLGREIRSFTVRVRANVPGLPERRQDWHSDVSILDGGEFAKVRIACWVPLSDVDGMNGTLEIIPGIRTAPVEHEIRGGKHVIPEEAVRGREKRLIACREGSGVFLDAFMPHRAVPNLSGAIRWSVIAWMMT